MIETPGSIHRFAHEAMATLFEIIVAGGDGEYARQASRAAFDGIDRLERLFSRFDPSSEISRLGRLRPGETLRIGLETYQVLRLAAWVEAETGGAFDVNFRARRPTEAAPSTGSMPDTLLRLEPLPGGYQAIRLPGSGNGPPGAVDLDLGGIGKGFALDAAGRVLADWEVADALLHGGTSTAIAAGSAPGRPTASRGWPVGAATAFPGAAGAPIEIVLRDMALSGSGFEVKGPHVIDPRTGRAAAGHRAAWAAHGSAALADALSTAFLVMSPDEVERFCAAHPDVWALVIPAPDSCRIWNAAALDPGDAANASDRRSP